PPEGDHRLLQSRPRAAPRGATGGLSSRLRPAVAAIACAIASLIATPLAAASTSHNRAIGSPARPQATKPPVAPPVARLQAAKPAATTSRAARRPAVPKAAHRQTAARAAPVRRPPTRQIQVARATIAPGLRPAVTDPAPADQGTPPPQVAAALATATRLTGTEPAVLRAIAWQESRFSGRARNRASSATGLMQFTETTWLEVVRDYGPRHGLASAAALLRTDPKTGAIATRRPKDLRHILALRFDPRLSAIMAGERLAAERAALQAMLGRTAGPTELYVTHLLGPAGARRFLAEFDRMPNRAVAEVVGADSLAANPGVFLDRGSGRRLSLAEVHAGVGRMLADRMPGTPELALAAR
ncbi:MAG: hypothetical protein JWP04_584, partial [Belnapia sp.]|nr:hypothetical protein [Belnapia sp.]